MVRRVSEREEDVQKHLEYFRATWTGWWAWKVRSRVVNRIARALPVTLVSPTLDTVLKTNISSGNATGYENISLLIKKQLFIDT